LLHEVVAEVIGRHQARRRGRRAAWQAHVKTAQAWRAGLRADGRRSRDAGLEL
jgi:hypothetical protein